MGRVSCSSTPPTHVALASTTYRKGKSQEGNSKHAALHNFSLSRLKDVLQSCSQEIIQLFFLVVVPVFFSNGAAIIE
jgi:hypothetical protein